MKIAIPTFATRVSPRFDCARYVLVLTVDDGEELERHEFTAGDWAPHERIKKLLELGVDTVVCGGIDRCSVASLQSAGVTVYGWMAGEVEDALAALLRGALDCDAQSGEGGGCRCKRFAAEGGGPDRTNDDHQGRRRRRRQGGAGGP